MSKKMENDSLGNRMKGYENCYRIYLTPKVPVIIRVDGEAFHSFTQHLDKPFSQTFMDAIVKAAIYASRRMQGFKLGYVQSDEASFLLHDFEKEETQPWFGYNLSKIITTAATLMSTAFNYALDLSDFAIFDGRAANYPQDDTANYFVWRYKDWQRNSLQMYCQSFFSHKNLDGKGREDQHEMLHSIGKNWAKDLSWREKNGTFIFPGGKTSNDFVDPGYYDINYDLISNWIISNPFERFEKEAQNGGWG